MRTENGRIIYGKSGYKEVRRHGRVKAKETKQIEAGNTAIHSVENLRWVEGPPELRQIFKK